MYAEATKVCNGPLCQGQERPRSDFNRNNSKADGLQARCRRCDSEYQKDEKTKTRRRRTRGAWKDRDLAAAMFQQCKSRAKHRSLEFGLTLEWFRQKLLACMCEVTGIVFVLNVRRHPFMPSIDRIDSSKGYTPDNCRVVLWIINQAKNDISEDDFQSALRQVAEAVLERC